MNFRKNEKYKVYDFTAEKLVFFRYLLRYFISKYGICYFHLSHIISFCSPKFFPLPLLWIYTFVRYIITFCSYNGYSIDHMPCRTYNFGLIFFTFHASGKFSGNAANNETNDFEFALYITLYFHLLMSLIIIRWQGS